MAGFLGFNLGADEPPTEVQKQNGMAQLGAQPGLDRPNTWAAATNDPVARSAMLAMGLQLMTGGWGNGVQQLAAGMGAGAESAGATQKYLDDQAREDQKLASASADRAAARQTQMDVAKLNADNRLEIAQARVAGMLERTKMNVLGKATPDVATKYRALALKEVQGVTSNLGLDQASISELVDRRANEMMTQDIAAGKLKNFQPGSITGSEPATGVQPQADSKPIMTWEKIQKIKDFDEVIKDPAGKAELIRRYPQYQAQIEAYQLKKPLYDIGLFPPRAEFNWR